MRLLASILAAIQAVSGAVPALAVNLRASGAVVVNSVPVRDGATVRTGDTLATGFDSLAILISAAAGRAELRADSEARLAPEGLILSRGAAAASRLPISVGRYTIRPASSEAAWYAVGRRSGRLVVAAHRGSVLIASLGEPPVVVPEGSYAQSEDQEASPPPRSRSPRRKGARPAAGVSADTAGGWTIGGLSHAASVALVVGIGAGVAAVTAGVVSLGGSGPSPDD
jgi:hypothetical protein